MTLAKPPARFTKDLSDADARQVARWWSALAEDDRRALFDARGAALGRYVEANEDGDADQATTDWYEYAVGHDLELWPVRVFHICSAHERARAATEAGFIPAAFACPLADAACPMRAILDQAPGRSVRLLAVESLVRAP